MSITYAESQALSHRVKIDGKSCSPEFLLGKALDRSDSGRLGLPGLSRRGSLQEWKERGPNPEEIGRQGVGAKCSPGHWEKRNLKVREWGKVPLPA